MKFCGALLCGLLFATPTFAGKVRLGTMSAPDSQSALHDETENSIHIAQEQKNEKHKTTGGRPTGSRRRRDSSD